MDIIVILIILLIIVLAGIIVYLFSIKIVSQSDVVVIERMGKYHRILNSGFNMIWPFIDTVRATLSVQEEIIDIPRQSVITKDNVSITIDGILYIKIDDPAAAVYNVQNYKSAITHLAMTTLRGEIGEISLDDTLSNRAMLNSELQKELSSASLNWGVRVMRVEISEISVPKDIEEAMNKQMKAEREKRAMEILAQAEKEKIIREAEAEKAKEVLLAEGIERTADAKKKEKILLAEGEKKALELIGLSMLNPLGAEYVLAKERIKSFQKLAESSSRDKLIIPYETSEMLGSISVLKDLLVEKLETNKELKEIIEDNKKLKTENKEEGSKE